MALDARSSLLDGGTPILIWLVLGAALLLVTGGSAGRVVVPGQRAVVVRLGRPRRVRGPGLVLKVPGLEQVRMISVTPTSIRVPLRGNAREGARVSLTVEAQYQIVDPVVALETHPDIATRLVDDLERSTHHALAAATLPQLLFGRELLATRLQVAANRRTIGWGVRLLDVEVTNVEVELSREVLRWVR